MKTLYERAVNVPCLPRVRLSFHHCLFLGGLTGPRLSTMLRLLYRDVALAVVRDPHNPKKTKIVATITIGKNKQQREYPLSPQDHFWTAYP